MHHPEPASIPRTTGAGQSVSHIESQAVTVSAEPFAARLRRLREEKGLSQTDLARGLLSPSYLSHLEAGARSPSARTIAQLAERLGVSVTSLRDGEPVLNRDRARLALAYAELTLHNGEPAAALAEFKAILADESVDDADHVSAALGVARAHEGLGELEAAMVTLRSLLERAHREPAAVPLLTVAMSLSRCYRQAGDLGRSVLVAEDALRRCKELGLTGTLDHVRLASTLVAAHTEMGDLVHAGVLMRELVADVEDGREGLATAAAYWNAALLEDEQGHQREALRLAERALASYGEGADVLASARLRVALGWLLMRQQPAQPETALEVLLTARARLKDLGTSADLASCATEVARARLLLGDPVAAAEEARAALGYLQGADGVEAALTLLVLGRSLIALGQSADADAVFAAALRLARDAGANRQSAAMLRELGEVHLELGRHAQAAQAFRAALDYVQVRPTLPGVVGLVPSLQH